MRDKPETYVSLDVETNGPVPGIFSMLAFGVAIFDFEGNLQRTLQVNLNELRGTIANPETMKWWQEQPQETWDSIRVNCVNYSTGIKQLRELLAEIDTEATTPVAIAWPAAFDHMWINYYGWLQGNDYLLGYACLDIRSYLQGILRLRAHYELQEEDTEKIWGLPQYQYEPYIPHNPLSDAIKQGELFFHIRNQQRSLAPFLQRSW